MKKQLNYKSLNTLGDVDITQSIVTGGGEENESGGAEPTEYYIVNWVKAAENGYVTDGVVNYEMRANVFTLFSHICSQQGSSHTLYAPTSLLLAVRSLEILNEQLLTVVKVAFTPHEILLFANGLSNGEQYLSLTNKYPLLIEKGIFTPITKEEFYKLPAALTIYTYSKDVIAHQDEMKFAFDTLWAIWERDGVEGQELAITIPNADVASITEIGNEGTFASNITSMRGGTTTSDSDTVTYIEFNGQYGPQISKVENLNTGEITYLYHFES